MANQMKQVDEILKKTIEIMEQTQKEIFDIAEHAQQVLKEIERELESLKEKAVSIIEEVEKLRKEESKARYRLLVVSKNFNTYSEEDIKETYEKAERLKVMLSLKEQEEKSIRDERNKLELKLKNERKLMKKAENAISHMGAVLDYLRVGAQGIDSLAEDVRKKQYIGYRVIKATEEERRRLVREIHDVPVQALVNMGIRLELCLQTLDKDINKARDYIKELKEQVNQNIKELRRIIHNQRPMSLDDLGLIATLEKHLQNFEETTGIKTSFRLVGQPVEIKGLVQIALFRIIQEALSNVKRHSAATRAMVKMEFVENSVSLLIADDGVGFDVSEYKNMEGEENGGFGLMGMRERVELLQGYMGIDSQKGKGTSIFVRIPLS
jgi:two-component system sensor histidine kinase DegS